jgi:hypothetical protein
VSRSDCGGRSYRLTFSRVHSFAFLSNSLSNVKQEGKFNTWSALPPWREMCTALTLEGRDERRPHLPLRGVSHHEDPLVLQRPIRRLGNVRAARPAS